MGGIRTGADDWKHLLAAWLKAQDGQSAETVLDLNKEMILRNALPFGAVWDLNWWTADGEHADTWRAQGWRVSPSSNVAAGRIIFVRDGGAA